MKKNEPSFEYSLIKSAIRKSMCKALASKPVIVHAGKEKFDNGFFEIDGEIYDEIAAIEKILGDYSWYKE